MKPALCVSIDVSWIASPGKTRSIKDKSAVKTNLAASHPSFAKRYNVKAIFAKAWPVAVITSQGCNSMIYAALCDLSEFAMRIYGNDDISLFMSSVHIPVSFDNLF